MICGNVNVIGYAAVQRIQLRQSLLVLLRFESGVLAGTSLLFYTPVCFVGDIIRMGTVRYSCFILQLILLVLINIHPNFRIKAVYHHDLNVRPIYHSVIMEIKYKKEVLPKFCTQTFYKTVLAVVPPVAPLHAPNWCGWLCLQNTCRLKLYTEKCRRYAIYT